MTISPPARCSSTLAGRRESRTSRSVLSILSNHVYAGLVEHRIGFREGCHPALIDRDLYHKVQNWIVVR